MSFKAKDVEKLLVATGRRCCLCDILHRVQVHHIVHLSDGGTDDIDNGIPLCPNCHDEVHGRYAPGRTTRPYSQDELRGHRERAIAKAASARAWAPGSEEFDADKRLIQFYAECLDRPAFREPFHLERSYTDLDKALEDTLTAINTGYLATRDGRTVKRATGKSALVNASWRDQMEKVVVILEGVRRELRAALGLDSLLLPGAFSHHGGIRMDWDLAKHMDSERGRAVRIVSKLLKEAGLQPLKGIGWS